MDIMDAASGFVVALKPRWQTNKSDTESDTEKCEAG